MNAVPIVLLAAIWAGFATLLKLAELINERRDKILNVEEKLSYWHRRRILYSDWLVYIAMVVFHLSVFAFVFALIPDLFQLANSNVAVTNLCHVAAAFPMLFVVITVMGGIKDYLLMTSFLRVNKALFNDLTIKGGDTTS